jgi:hypothetical protein
MNPYFASMHVFAFTIPEIWTSMTTSYRSGLHWPSYFVKMTWDALELTEQVVQLRKTKLGEAHPDTLTSMHNLAVDYSEAGRRSEALQLAEHVVQLRKTKLGEDHPDTLTSMELLTYITERDSGNSQKLIGACQSQATHSIDSLGSGD